MSAMPDDAPSSPVPSAPAPEVDVPALSALLDGRYADVRRLVRTNLAEHASILEDAETMSRAAFRRRVLDVVTSMASTGQTGFGFPKEYGGGEDIGASVAAFETLAFGDLSVVVKVGVQFGLFGGAILQLGTERHHDAYLEDLIHGRLLGCFAMTETGHGSNVQALGTIATYDADSAEFVIDTPDERARKDYIGNAAEHASHAVVFAQLRVGDEAHGVHAFVVPIRDEDGRPAAGVRIEDCGPKIGLNGVDNGRLWFSGVRVPRTSMLDRYATVGKDGRYSSDIENPDRRFFTMLGTLVQGRVCVGGAAINASKVALTIATRYALRRRQFEATSTEEEELLLDYGQHQRRLFPLLAQTYALHFAQEVVAAQCHEVFSGLTSDELVRKELESRAAGTKALGTWHATRTIQECREACGGAGYLAVNRFDALRGHGRVHDVRGRQHHPHAAGREGPAHRLQGLLRGPRPDRHGALRRVDRGRDADRAHQRPVDLGAASQRRTGGRPEVGGCTRARAARRPVPARDADLAGGAPALLRGPPAQARHGRRHRRRPGLQRLPGPRHQGGPRARRADRPGGVPRQARRGRGGAEPRGADTAVRALRAHLHRGGPRLVPRARPALRGPLEGRHRAGERAEPADPADRGRPGGRVRGPAGGAARRDPGVLRFLTRPARRPVTHPVVFVACRGRSDGSRGRGSRRSQTAGSFQRKPAFCSERRSSAGTAPRAGRRGRPAAVGRGGGFFRLSPSTGPPLPLPPPPHPSRAPWQAR